MPVDRMQTQRNAGVIDWYAERPIDRGEVTMSGGRFVGISPNGIPWEAYGAMEFRRFCREFDRRYRGFIVQDDGYAAPEPGSDPHAPFARRRANEAGSYPDVPVYEPVMGSDGQRQRVPAPAARRPTARDIERAEVARIRGAPPTYHRNNTHYMLPHPTVPGRWCRLDCGAVEASMVGPGGLGVWYLSGNVPEWVGITCTSCGDASAVVSVRDSRDRAHALCETCRVSACSGCGGPGRFVSASRRRYCADCAGRHGLHTCNICGSAGEGRHEHCVCGQRRSRDEVGPCGCGRYHIRGYSDRTANLLPPLGIPSAPAGIRSKRGVAWYGVELEQECIGDASLAAGHAIRAVGEDYAVAKSDSSVRNGFELVTARATLAAHSERLGRPDVFRGCRDNGASAGMHVHASRDALTPLQLGKMLVLVNSPENDAFIRDVAGRVSTYATRGKKKITDGTKYPSSRYEALNLTNTHTVEFRIFASSTEPSTILGRLEFVDAVIAYCATASIRALDWARFRDWVCSQPRKRWPHFAPWFEAYRPGHTLSGLPILGLDSDDDDSDDDGSDDDDE